jgi:P4 family phage/plasmid primase-like protien
MSQVKTPEELRREHGGSSALDEYATEQQLAALLKAELPPIRCVGEDWYVYQNGLWQKTNRDTFKPRALSIQNPKARTARKALNALNHIEYGQQCGSEEFRSFCCFGIFDDILINCANGVLRVMPDKAELEPHEAEHLFTGQLDACYDPDATAPTFERVLQEALPDPADLRLLQIFSGYLLYPDCRFEAALVCFGPGGTSKSTLSEAIQAVIGPKLVCNLSLEQICDPQSKLLAQLQYRALNISTELNALEVGGETFKKLVSGECVQADRKFRDDIRLCTGCKHWFNTNSLPRFRYGTDAELRRLRILHFNKIHESVDVTLKEKLSTTERGGVMLFMVDGLRALMQLGKIPAGGQESVRIRERFDIQNDPLGAFIKTECILGSTREIEKADLFNAYVNFRVRNGLPQPTDNSFFSKELLTRFAVENVRRRDGNERVQKLHGIELTPDD